MQSDFWNKDLRNLLITISYDGKRYHGWQVQKNALTVQEVFQRSLIKLLCEEVDIKGCSRTDSGVHANKYCVSVKTRNRIPCSKLAVALNKYLPGDISAKSCIEVPLDFHARYSCIGKEYVYKIWNNKTRNPFMNGYVLNYWYPIDEDKLNMAAKSYIGTHDFTSFCTLDSRDRENMIRSVNNFNVRRKGDLVEMSVESDGFLYNMVRIMVGTLLRVAQGKICPTQVEKIIEEKKRSAAGPTAPPQGLYLNRVFYEGIEI